jgi:hypothetical protein
VTRPRGLAGWNAAEPWTPLRRDLSTRVSDPGVRVEVVGPVQGRVRTAVQRASFDVSTFTDERWLAMARGLPYGRSAEDASQVAAPGRIRRR